MAIKYPGEIGFTDRSALDFNYKKNNKVVKL